MWEGKGEGVRGEERDQGRGFGFISILFSLSKVRKMDIVSVKLFMLLFENVMGLGEMKKERRLEKGVCDGLSHISIWKGVNDLSFPKCGLGLHVGWGPKIPREGKRGNSSLNWWIKVDGWLRKGLVSLDGLLKCVLCNGDTRAEWERRREEEDLAIGSFFSRGIR